MPGVSVKVTPNPTRPAKPLLIGVISTNISSRRAAHRDHRRHGATTSIETLHSDMRNARVDLMRTLKMEADSGSPPIICRAVTNYTRAVSRYRLAVVELITDHRDRMSKDAKGGQAF